MCEQDKTHNQGKGRIFAPLRESLSDILPLFITSKYFDFPPIKQHIVVSIISWYNATKFYEFPRKSENNTNGCILLNHEIQDLINDIQVSTGVVPPNQHLGIFKNHFPNHDQSVAACE